MSIFNSVPITKPKRNLFNLSYSNRFSCKLGQLVPIFCKPVVPGDTFKVSSEIFIRTAPLVSPMYQEMKVYVHYFYVPNRLIMDKWEQFISPHATLQEPNPTELVLPHIDMKPDSDPGSTRNDLLPEQLFETGELLDFLGYNRTDYHKKVSLLPINAYNLIYQQYYRDQNLGKASTIDDPVILNEARYYPVDWSDEGVNYSNLTGESLTSYFKLRQKAWKKDYFTSALPFTQRGADVRIPLYGNGQISSVNDYSAIKNTSITAELANSLPGTDFALIGVSNPQSTEKQGFKGYGVNTDTGGFTSNFTAFLQSDPFIDNQGHGDNQPATISNLAKHLTLDLEQVNAATINEFRRALALQKYFETSARVGGRYKEFVLGHFGVNVPDGRLQRAEYLGGGMQVLNIGEVVQTSSTISTEHDTYPLGQMAGRGIAYGNQNKFKHTFVEHGYVLGIMSIQPDAAYYQGIQKDLQKLDRLDFYTPEFAQIGEQPIAVSELFVKGLTEDQMNETFGYTPRYAEYKFSLNEIHGEFKTTLDTWHMARKFDSKPTLSKEFIEINEYEDGLNRVFAVQGSEEQPIEHFYCFVKNNVKALRPMPVYGVPSL